MIIFEFDKTIEIPSSDSLKKYLHRIWQEKFEQNIDIDEELHISDEYLKTNYQPFLTFDGKLIRARNYVGFIQIDDTSIEIYPKVFKNTSAPASLMMRHLFFWFDYCRKWKFPFNKSNLDSFDDVEFPELIMYLMASTLLETVSSLPISLYQHIEEPLISPKGKIDFNKYLASGFVTGNQHLINCEYDPFVFDNKLNRAIKYVSRLLLNKTKYSECQNILSEIIFILDEVEDKSCSISDLETVVINPLFAEYNEVKDICKIVLQQLLYANQQYNLSQWSLLFPMEYIFEDFIAGFLEFKFRDTWKVEYQKSNLNLSNHPVAFRMQHDILLTLKKNKSRRILVDTKYKLRESNYKFDKKKGIAQSDMYQMVSYALRQDCSDVLLLYPNLDEQVEISDSFIVESTMLGDRQIRITAAEIPFWSISNFHSLSAILTTELTSILDGIIIK